MKDLFSAHSEAYAQFRPNYPAELFNLLRKICHNREKAWDCATGNGQVAGELANFFEQVYATDISINQLSQAIQKENIHYTKQAAETTIFLDSYFDLLTVAQAVHWFQFERFYAEVQRVLKKDAVIAIFGYGLFKSDPATNEVINHFYNIIIGKYWLPGGATSKKLIEQFPFHSKKLKFPKLR